MQRVSHQRNTKFRLHDVLYKISIDPKVETDPAPLLWSLFPALASSMEFIIKELKRYVEDEKDVEHQVYVTIIQDGITNGKYIYLIIKV